MSLHYPVKLKKSCLVKIQWWTNYKVNKFLLDTKKCSCDKHFMVTADDKVVSIILRI